MSGVVYRLRGVDYEGLSHPQRQALVHRFEAALRLLDEHCRVYQYLLKRTVGPFVAMPCEAADRQRGDPASGGVPERPPAGPVRPVALSRAALRSAACRETKDRASPVLAGARRGAPRLAVDGPGTPASRIGAGPSHRDAPPQGAGVRGPDRGIRSRAAGEADGVPILPRAR